MGWDSSGEGLTKVTFEQRPKVGDKGQAFLVTRRRMCATEERGVGPDMWWEMGSPYAWNRVNEAGIGEDKVREETVARSRQAVGPLLEVLAFLLSELRRL